jgi:NAD(P)-dependent dehydrogenase (short-subunit alcohol dehydrogenase family)
MVNVTTNIEKVALVTGANKGIGKAIAKSLARDGFLVLLGARDAARGATAAAELQADGAVRFLKLDVTQEASVSEAAQKVEAEFGRLDVLVNNAGIHAEGPPQTPVEETADDLRLVYETNVFAVVRMTNAFLPLLRRSTAGRIVNVTSKRVSIGEEGAWVGQPSMAYSSSKTASNAVTVHYARFLMATPIKVNGAAPGHVATDFNGFRGTRTPEDGAAVAIWLAQLGADGPTGVVFEDDQQLAW